MQEFRFICLLIELNSSLSVMNMLAQHAESNILQSICEIDKPGAVKTGEYPVEKVDNNGDSYDAIETYYEYGSCIGIDHDSVVSEYKYLITQLTRRSAFLTIFGLFEYRMSQLLKFLTEFTDYQEEINNKGIIEKVEFILKKILKHPDKFNVDHITVVRNIMIHNNGIATDYNKLINKKTKKTGKEKRLLNAINKFKGLKVNMLDGVIMDDKFLTEIIKDFELYKSNIEIALKAFKELKE